MKMKTSPNDVSNREILKELNRLNEKMDTGFSKIDGKIEGLDGKVASLDGKIANLDGKVASLDGKIANLDGKVASLDGKIDGVHMETMEAIRELADQSDKMEFRINRVESRMVTKDYLDDKLADQYSKIIAHTDKRIEKALS
ncbi:hypothetical protein IPH19_02880 [Candidatus Uhrbacteria bacterium]|nr:MAG: hypothetical protein IPH19_02880 [Candidatus Uhrbacteria bacterium]